MKWRKNDICAVTATNRGLFSTWCPPPWLMAPSRTSKQPSHANPHNTYQLFLWRLSVSAERRCSPCFAAVPVLEPQVLVETQEPPQDPGGVPTVVPDKEREGTVNEVKLRFVYRFEFRPPICVRHDDVTAVREIVCSGSEHCIPRLGEILKGEEEYEP